MKALLCSEAFCTPNTVDDAARLVGKPKSEISVGIINEAYAVERGDKRWVLNNLTSAWDNFGGEVDMVNLLALSMAEVEQRLADKDIIYVIGGNTDYLMTVFAKTGFDRLLAKLLETKVYVGSSAGSMVLGKRISEAAYHLIYGEDSPYNVEPYLELVDLSIMPHLDSPLFANRRETLIEAVGDFDGLVYGLRDDSAVVVDGDTISTIGSEPVIFNQHQ